MTVEITLSLPENLIEHAQWLGEATEQNAAMVLANALEMMWPTLQTLPDTAFHPLVSTLSDEDVLSLANTKMDRIQNERLGALQAKGKLEGLSEAERYELLALMQIYQVGQLRKSQGLAEAVRRGLQEPLPA